MGGGNLVGKLYIAHWPWPHLRTPLLLFLLSFPQIRHQQRPHSQVRVVLFLLNKKSDVDRSRSDAERDVLKRTYLTLLPPTQLLELCLAFEAHVPLAVRNSLWPSDLKAAVAGLQHPYATPTSQPPPPPPPPVQNPSIPPPQPPPPTVRNDDPPMASLREDEPPQHPPVSEDVLRSLAAVLNAASASTSNGDSSQTNASTQPTSQTPSATPSLPQQPAASSSGAPYAQTPYGYAQQTQPSSKQSAYPHAPYYTQPGYSGHYPYPYPPTYGSSQAYAASSSQQPQAGPSTPRPPLQSRYTSKEPVKAHTEDLPSYEDMIVEALLDINDLDGCVPKTLFQWMAEHYPLQSNFRPSASQALQKAYKRGRLDKSATGRYKINASWDGGSTSSRRATRRPQSSTHHTLQQSHHARQNTSSSPFTHAPLPHRPSPGPPPQAHQQTPPQTYSYPYSYPGYQGYPPAPTAQNASAPNPPTTPASSTSNSHPHPPVQASTNGSSASTGGKEKQADSDGNDAWQLLYNLITNGGVSLPSQPSASTAPQSSQAGTSSASTAIEGAGEPALSDQDRAALQAQLALLAEQLQAIEEGDDDDEMDADESADPLMDMLVGLGSVTGVGGSQSDASRGAGSGIPSMSIPGLPSTSTDNDTAPSGNLPSPSAVSGGTTPIPTPMEVTEPTTRVDEPVMGSLAMDAEPTMVYNADEDEDDDDDMEMVM
ncbi:hypothetical protein OF83DRAFT_77318 [Amylostereum chailletii]|nr:hypothetical protein OF83DRAFT_77318 [Amylostereum chailletii]